MEFYGYTTDWVRRGELATRAHGALGVRDRRHAPRHEAVMCSCVPHQGFYYWSILTHGRTPNPVLPVSCAGSSSRNP